MKKTTSYNPIIIIGMHRSGTTMLAKFISELGVFLGSSKNRGSNHESYFFMKINKWIISQRGGRWDFPENLIFDNDIQTSLIKSHVIRTLKSHRTREFFGGKFGLYYKNLLNANFKFGWKDPRTSLLLDFWKEIYPDAKIIHIYRNPIDVSNSLAVREIKMLKNYKSDLRKKYREYSFSSKPVYNQSNRLIDINQGIKVWEYYINCCLNADSYFEKVLHIKYEDFIENPKKVLESVSDFIKVRPKINLINKTVSNVDTSRRYSFISNDNLVKKYYEIKNIPVCKKLGYDNII